MSKPYSIRKSADSKPVSIDSAMDTIRPIRPMTQAERQASKQREAANKKENQNANER
jgi:hypothetical protein